MNESINKEGQLITDKQLADFLQVSLKKVQQMARGKDIPGIRIGRSWRFFPDDVRKFVRDI